MISAFVQSIQAENGTTVHAGIEPALLDRFEVTERIAIPREHRQLLQLSNGIEAFHGYIRLFGLYTTESIDAIEWNQYEYWKFAWGNKCSGFWCFGETAWGDQYAYAIQAPSEEKRPEIYFLDAFSMSAEIVAPSFGDFFEQEFIRFAKEPYDQTVTLARQKFGRLGLKSHLIYVPSLLLGGKEDIANVQLIDARAGMICNGDIASQLASVPPESATIGIQPFEDEQGRARLKLLWKRR